MSEHKQPSGGLGFGKSMLYIAIASLASVLLFKFYQNYKLTGGSGTYTHTPTEVDVTYIPADFDYQLDDENSIAILSNPHRYKREFNELIYGFNMSLLNHVAKRMNLPDSLSRNVEQEYRKHHEYLKQLYFNDYVNIRDTSSNIYESWYDNEASGAIETMNEVASKYTCFLINHVIVTMLKTEGTLNVKGANVDTPCGIAMNEAVRPMLKRLESKAAILDFGRSKGMLEEKVEKAIAELATMEVKDKKGLSKQLQSKVFGYAVSSTELEVSAISILKVGFKINDYFDIKLDDRKKTVYVTLPAPQILSHEVYPRIEKLDIGWMRELENVDFNKNFNILRTEFRRDALESDIMTKAQEKADELMHLMLSPLVTSMHRNFKLKVRFQENQLYQDPDIASPGENIENPDAGVLTERRN